jgi:hypothetical protein
MSFVVGPRTLMTHDDLLLSGTQNSRPDRKS